jgi:protein ImuB
MHMGYGVEGIILTAYWTQSIPHLQMDAWESSCWKEEEEFNAFLDTITNRWGKNRVLVAHPVASHTPEIARQFRPATEITDSKAEIICLERPSLLLERPEEAEAIALLPDHAPAWLRWRNQEHILETGSGPERIVTAWWSASRKKASTRDYFKVRNQDASWLWVFRELESGRWFVHGIWA